MRELNTTELDQVSGGVTFIGGAIFGIGSYLAANAMTGRRFDAAELAAAATMGAVTSGLSAIGGTLTGAANIARAAHSTSIGTLSSAAVYGVVDSIGGGSKMATGTHIMDKHK